MTEERERELDDRRRDDHRQTQIEAQVGNLSAGMSELIERMDKLEEGVQSGVTERHDLKVAMEEGLHAVHESLTVAEGKSRDIRHDLANNTQATKAIFAKVALSGAKLDSFGDKLEEAVSNSAAAVEIMKNLKALDRLADLGTKGLKWITPIVGMVATAIIAIKAIWK